jgi:hypothetical protein
MRAPEPVLRQLGGFGFGYGSGASLAEPPNLFPGPAMPALPNPAGLAIPAARIADVCSIPERDTTMTERAQPLPTSGWFIGQAAIYSTTIRS